jgi:Domain of unknown function (DUF4296)
MLRPTKCFCLCFLFFMIACKGDQVPEGIIEKKQMQTILLDMVKAEEFVTNYVMKDSTKKHQQECMLLYQKVFAIHKTNSKDFLKSFDYYLTTPKVARDMFDSLSNQSSRITTTLRTTYK